MKILFVLWMLVRRILSQWRLELWLFLGLMVAMAVVTAVPLYTNGALQESLLENMKESAYNDVPPFTYTVSIADDPGTGEKTLTKKKLVSGFEKLRRYPVPARIRIPLITSGWSGSMYSQFEVPDPKGITTAPITAEVLTMSGLNSLVTYKEGRAPGLEVDSDGTVEMACTVAAAVKYGLIVGNTYPLKSEMLAREKNSSSAPDEPEPTTGLKFRLVGTFNLRNDRLTDPRWLIYRDFSSVLFVDPGAFMEYLVGRREVAVSTVDLTWVMDYRQVRVRDLGRLIGTLQDMDRDYVLFEKTIHVSTTPVEVVKQFVEEQRSLQLMMLTLAAPTLLLIIYYILLMAGLIVDGRRGEIAMLRSRGAGTIQLTGMFTLEWAILALCCWLVGPPLGLFLAQVVGASAGFLSLVDRQALPVEMVHSAYTYGAALAVIMVTAATVPAALACQNTIIQYKQERSRGGAKPFWRGFYLDFLFLGMGFYGYRLLALQSQAVEQSSASLDLLVDPLLFLIPIVVVLGGGLLLLRIIPWVAGLFEQLTGRSRGVTIFSSLVEVSRNISGFSPLILLIILTTATGIYGAAIARTLDQNTHDRLYYANGADVVLRPGFFRWNGPVLDTEHAYENSFSAYGNTPGVLGAARVQLTPNVRLTATGHDYREATVMAIDPYDFGRTAQFEPGLTPLHPNVYLNLMTRFPQAALVSPLVLRTWNYRIGDTIPLRIHETVVYVVIAGVVKYWPTLNEDVSPFVIANLSYITQRSAVRPYVVWIRMKPGAKLQPVLEALTESGVPATPSLDTRQELIMTRRDPKKMGLYGIMSIGFCVAILVTVLGYILYTFMGLKKGQLQFGVMRALGLSSGQLMGILGFEQLWTAGIGLAAGSIFGGLISVIFIPFLKSATAITGEIPPFRVVVSGQDMALIFCVFLPIFILALLGLAVFLVRRQVHQAVKLGEEG